MASNDTLTTRQAELSQILNQISAGDSSAAIRIQIGRSVVYKGSSLAASALTLTPTQVDDLILALAHPQGGFSSHKSAITITCNGEPVYRSTAKEGVTLNQIAAGVEAAEPEAILLEPEAELEPELEPGLADSPSAPLPAQVNDLESIAAPASQPELNPFRELQPDPALDVDLDPALEPVLEPELQPAPAADDLNIRLASPSATDPELESFSTPPLVDADEVQVLTSSALEQPELRPEQQPEVQFAPVDAQMRTGQPQPQVPVSPALGSTLRASEVFMMELAELPSVADQTRQWLYDQFKDLSQSQLVQTLQQEGPQWTRNALSQFAQISEQVMQKGVADSLFALSKQYGRLYETPEGDQQFHYETEKYKITTQGTHHLTMSDRATGKTLFSFRYGAASIQPTSPCNLSLSQRFEVIQAGATLAATLARATAQSGVERLQTLAQGLATLAPAGTAQQLAKLQQQQAVQVADMLASSRQAITTAAGQMFSGSQFQVFKTPSSLRVFAQDGRGELLTRIGNTVKGRMNPLDLSQMGKTAQTLMKAVSQQVHTNMHGALSKSESGR